MAFQGSQQQAVGIDGAELAAHVDQFLKLQLYASVGFLVAVLLCVVVRWMRLVAPLVALLKRLGSLRRRWNLCCRRHPRDDREILLDRLSQGWWSQVLGGPDSEHRWFNDNHYILRDAIEELRGDREVVMTAVRRHGGFLQYATEELRGDREIVMAAVSKYDKNALRYATEELRGDRKIVMAAVSKHGNALEYATDELRADREIVMKAMSKYERALRHASVELRGDRGIVMKAVSSEGTALEYASEELRGDRGIVMKAVSSQGTALEYATEELRADREIVMKAMSNDPNALEYASEEFRADRDTVMSAVSNNVTCSGHFLEYATEELRADRDFVMKAVSERYDAFNHASEELRGDREIMEVVLRHAARQQAWGQDPVVALKVTLLSGRCCTQIYLVNKYLRNHELRQHVLLRFARLLGLDGRHVKEIGTLLQGTRVIENLRMLEAYKLHELTLVLSMPSSGLELRSGTCA